jgi:hypothetical protein
MESSAANPVPRTLVDRLKATVMSGAFGPKSLGLPDLVKALLWQSRLSAHFVVNYHDDTGADDDLLDTLSGACGSICTELVAWMQLPTRSKQARIALERRLIIYVIRTTSPITFGSIESPGVLFYLLDPLQDPDYLVKFQHEIAHLVWGRSYGEAPPLFNEGVAVYAEPAHRAGRPAVLPVAGLPSLVDLVHTDRFWDAYRTGLPVYGASGLWVRYLVERWGWERLGTLFLASEYGDPEILEHFASVYGCDLATAEVGWQRWLSGEEGCDAH